MALESTPECLKDLCGCSPDSAHILGTQANSETQNRACMPAARLVIMTKIPGFFDRIPFISSLNRDGKYGPGRTRTRQSMFVRSKMGGPSDGKGDGIEMAPFNLLRSIHVATEIHMVMDEEGEVENDTPKVSAVVYS